MCLGLFLAGLAALTLADHTLWAWLKWDKQPSSKDWYLMLRSAGYFPTWLLASAALVIGGSALGVAHARGWWRLGLSAGLAGLAAEILKLVVSRDRPSADGLHHYRGLFTGFADGSNLGMPSSHAAVAFGAAFAARRLFPGTGWVLFPLAVGCGLTRLFMGDHFTSDVYVAAWLGMLAARVCVPDPDRRRDRPGATRLTA